VTHPLTDTHSVLLAMSITPPLMGTFTDGFVRPEDMGDEQDGIPQSSALFSSERRIVTGFQNRKNMICIEANRFPSGYGALLETIKNIHESYRYLAIHRLSMDEKQKTFFITVKGNGSRYCMYRKGFHTSNRVYFCMNLKRSRIHMHCFDADCKRDHAANPISRALSITDRHRIATGFELPSTLERPTISPVLAVGEEPSSVVAADTPQSRLASKTSAWEAKRLAYNQSMLNAQ